MTRAHRPTNPAPPPMRFAEFVIRAWREDPKHIQVIAHASPVGEMRRPVTVRLSRVRRGDFELPFFAPLTHAADLGRELARVILPDPIHGMLIDSIGWAAARAAVGMRIRLCLDPELIDLPWETLYRRDLPSGAVVSGFLLADPDLSLVREPPVVEPAHLTTDRAQRAVFLGALHVGEQDVWDVRGEYASLVRATAGIRDRLDFEWFDAADSGAVSRRLSTPLDIFHYAGHADVDAHPGYLVQRAAGTTAGSLDIRDVHPVRAEWAASDRLATLLARAGTRLAVFNACNSGYWSFVRPFMAHGLPALIGIQGIVGNDAALAFSAALYRGIAVGLSIDESLTHARLAVLDAGMREIERDPAAIPRIEPCGWLRFMAYIPASDAVLVPRPASVATRREQGRVRQARADLASDLYQRLMALDGAGRAGLLSRMSRQQVLILGRFDPAHKHVIDTLRERIDAHPRGYRAMVFDFDKPRERNLTEAVRTYAALSRFIIADISAPRSVPQELTAIVPHYPSIPVVPIIAASEAPYSMFGDLQDYQWVLPTVDYRDVDDLLGKLDIAIIAAAEARLAARARD